MTVTVGASVVSVISGGRGFTCAALTIAVLGAFWIFATTAPAQTTQPNPIELLTTGEVTAPGKLLFRVDASFITFGGGWSNDSRSAGQGLYDPHVVSEEPATGTRIWEAILIPHVGPFGQMDEPITVTVDARNSKGQSLPATFRVEMRTCVADYAVYATKKGGAISYLGRCDLASMLTVWVSGTKSSKENVEEKDWHEVGSPLIITGPTFPPGPQTLTAKAKPRPVRKCFKKYEQCRIEVLSQVTTTLDGIPFDVAQTYRTNAAKKPKPK